MSAAVPMPARVALRPLALPAEHGGWGFLLEPIVLALLVAPSASGALLAAAAILGFLARHPLKLALQDALRGRSYPRTAYCRALAVGYLLGAAAAASAAIAMTGARMLAPFAIAAPLAIVQLAYDARGRSRDLLPELAGAVAMTGVAAAIAMCGGMPDGAAFGLAGILARASFPRSCTFARSCAAFRDGLRLRCMGSPSEPLPCTLSRLRSLRWPSCSCARCGV